MHNLFNPENKFFTFMGKVADLMILNVLCILCCLPIITIGASLTATYYMTMKIVRDEESYIVKGFFHSFTQNLKQSIVINLIMIAIGFILGFDIYLSWNMRESHSSFKLLIYLFISLALIYCMVLSYVYPLLAKFENTTKQLLKNSLLMSIRHFPQSILILLIPILPLALVFFFPMTLPMVSMFWIFFGFSVVCLLQSLLFVRIFDKYIPSEESEDDSEEISEEESNIFPPLETKNK